MAGVSSLVRGTRFKRLSSHPNVLARRSGQRTPGSIGPRTSVGWSEGVVPLEGVLQFVELCRALRDPFHCRVPGHHVDVAVKLLRRGQMTVWIFCRIRMMFDVPGGERILPVIKVGVLLGEEDSIFVISTASYRQILSRSNSVFVTGRESSGGISRAGTLVLPTSPVSSTSQANRRVRGSILSDSAPLSGLCRLVIGSTSMSSGRGPRYFSLL
jgi:hypothetical protein